MDKTERKAKFAALAKAIADMTDEQRAAMAAQMPVFSIEGRALSVRNMCLLAMQCPSVSIVGGFKQWIAAGRVVRKGEHGHMILIPSQGKPDEETGEAGALRFVSGIVFDVSQTDPLPVEQLAAA